MIEVTSCVADRRYTVIAKVWKAYQALLQYCCTTEYKQISEKLIDEKNEAINQIVDEYARKLQVNIDENKEIMSALKEKERRFNEIELEKDHAV